jgi:hypothetical protein
MRWKNGVSAASAAVVVALGLVVVVEAAPINPMAFKQQYESAKKGADVAASVRVISAVCTEAEGAGKARTVTLQVCLQVLDVEKGPVKKSDVLVVSRKVTLPAGPGPRAYGYMAELRRFPFTPGVEGSVALKWDNASRRYVGVAGWVPTPNNAAIPTEVGKAFVAGDAKKGL